MADVAPNSFENLTQSGLIKMPSKENKDVSLSVDVWSGNTSLVVFTGNGAKPWKTSLPAKLQGMIIHMLRKMYADPKPQRQPCFLQKFAEEKRKFEEVGCIGFGIDETLNFYIDVVANDLPGGRHLFTMKNDARYNWQQSDMKEKDLLQGQLTHFLTVFSTTIPEAERLSSFKRTGMGGGFNKGGGNRGGGGGYNNNQRQGGTFSGGGNSGGSSGGGADVSEDLYV